MNANAMRYYDLARHWTKRVVPHLDDAELNRILVRDFNKFTWGRWRKKFTAGTLPEDVESCDWRCEHRGPYPRYWAYVKHAACHWVVNFSLRLAMLAEPNRQWMIISTQDHSTVWDGKRTLFDFNFQAMGLSAPECFKAAIGGAVLETGEEMKVYYADHYTKGMSEKIKASIRKRARRAAA